MKQAIITFTFDDALDTHLDNAIPCLDAYGLKGTFYLNLSADSFGRRMDEWRRAAACGHELGNHTIFHPAVSRKEWVREGNAIELYTLDRMRMELTVANSILRELDGKEERTFAFPCSNPVLGRPGISKRVLAALGLDRTRLTGLVNRGRLDFGSREEDYTPVVKELFFAARCGGLPPDDLSTVPENRYRVRGVEGDGRTLAELSAAVDLAIERRTWTVFVFHGIGGGHHLSCDRDVYEQLVARLAQDRRVVVKTFLDAARDTWA
jgi:hypothetical protein